MADTPEALRDKLLKRLDSRKDAIKTVEDYYEGNHPLAFAAKKYRQAFGSQLSEFASNWCPIVIETPTERLTVEGFNFGKQEINDKAWSYWKANNLTIESGLVHTEAAKHGCAYVLVAPGDNGVPVITVEHPLHMVVQTAAENRRIRTAALKRWFDEDKFAYATLYLPDRIYKWKSQEAITPGVSGKPRWIVREEPAPNPLGVVPVVEFQNNPTMLHGGTSDLRDVIPLNDGINKLMCDLLVGSEFYAYPQRVDTGLEEAVDENGNPVPLAQALSDIASMYVLPDGSDLKQLEANDLSAYKGAIQEFLQQIAAITRTPPNYLLGQMVNISGDALIAAEKGLTSKVKDKQKDFGGSWEDVMRLAFLASGDESNATKTGDVQWSDPESRTLAQIVDPIVKMRQVLGIPLEVCWQMVGATPQQIEEWKTLAGLPDRTPPGGTFTTPVNGSTPDTNNLAGNELIAA